ncbi:MAG TPA: sulfite exporter TauE/SafE family protein [Limnochordales bacterium]
MTAILVAVGLGVAMGILTGMGIGGGKLLVPVMVLTIGLTQQGAQAISLAAFIPTALAAAWVHWRAGRIETRLLRGLAPWVLVGAVTGAWLANQMASAMLSRVYGLFLLAVGLYELWPRPSDRP